LKKFATAIQICGVLVFCGGVALLNVPVAIGFLGAAIVAFGLAAEKGD